MSDKNLSLRSFFAISLGTMIEYYDYALFALFLPIIAPLFFPASSIYQSLSKGYLALFLAMLARPLGGICFGYVGDKLGRRRALLGSIYGIAISTLLIGLIPTYNVIGIAAVITIILAKATQMFCFGGEYNGAGIYVVEHANDKNAALIGSLLTAAILLGALLGSLTGVITTLPNAPSYSWRFAFIFGGMIGLLSIIYRKNLLESPHFKPANAQQNLGHLIKTHPLELSAGIFIGGFATVPFTTVFTFLNPVLMTKGYFTLHGLMIFQSILIAIAILTLVFAGYVADKSKPAKVMQIGSLALIVLSYPLSLLFESKNFGLILISQIAFIIINEILLGPSNAYLKEVFSMQYRYRGSSLSFCLGMSVLGGLTPLAENYLYQFFGTYSAISIWLGFVGIGTFLSIYAVQRKCTFHNQKTIAFSEAHTLGGLDWKKLRDEGRK